MVKRPEGLASMRQLLFEIGDQLLGEGEAPRAVVDRVREFVRAQGEEWSRKTRIIGGVWPVFIRS